MMMSTVLPYANTYGKAFRNVAYSWNRDLAHQGYNNHHIVQSIGLFRISVRVESESYCKSGKYNSDYADNKWPNSIIVS